MSAVILDAPEQPQYAFLMKPADHTTIPHNEMDLDEDIVRVLRDHPGGIPDADVVSIVSAIQDLRIDAALLRLWESGETVVSWEGGSLAFRKK